MSDAEEFSTEEVMDAIKTGFVATGMGVLALVGILGFGYLSAPDVMAYEGGNRIMVSYNRIFSSLDTALASWEAENPGRHAVECRRQYKSSFAADWNCSVIKSR